MQSIENLAIETYTKNIEYLKQNHQNIITLLSALDYSINNNQYEVTYDLEYINGYFDIKNIQTGDYTYNSNSLDLSKDMAKIVNFQKDSYIFEGYPIYAFDDEVFDSNNTTKLLKGILPMMRYYKKNIQITGHMKNINKFIFIGVKLGLHIPIIHEKIHAQEYLIIEDDLEIFKLSLFTTEYYKLAQSAKLYFSVADDENLFIRTMKNYLIDTFYDNRYLKYLQFPNYSNSKLKQIQTAIMTQTFIFFPYKILLDKYLKPLEYINDDYHVLNLSKSLTNSFMQDKPVLVLGAGPSFKKNTQWLQQNHEKFIIIAASSVLNTLSNLDVHVNIVTHIDGEDLSSEHFNNINIKKDFRNTLFVLGANVSKLVRDKIPKSNIFYTEENTFYFEKFNTTPVSCVGSFSLLLSLFLQTNETYLLGLDFAVNQETGATHSSDHIISKEIDITKKDAIKDSMDYETNLFPVEGNFTDTVYTNGLLHASVQTLYSSIPTIKTDKQNIYNMNNGAKINKTSPKHIDDIDTSKYSNLNKSDLFKLLNELFLKNSKQKLEPNDVESLKMRLNNAKIVKNELIQYKESPTASNSDKYLYDLLGFISFTLKKKGRESANLTQVLYEYYQFSVPTIFDIFNTKNEKNEKRHIKKLDKFFVDEVSSICDIYINTLENFINDRC